MRLWTVHPQYLDPRGLVALWREGLLAQKVLSGQTRGYRRHPQLERFRCQADPAAAIAAYLHLVAEEALRREYRFDLSLVLANPQADAIEATTGQLAFEWRHLLAKLATRAPALAARCEMIALPLPHPLFHLVDGERASWERG